VRLLLVEDDQELLQHLKKELEASGYAVDTALNGVDAEYLGDEMIYDVAILDLGLPQRSGIDVLKNWRQRKNKIPVIVLTARNAWHERVDGFKAGADDYLGKPFHVEELKARLQALIHRSSSQPGGELVADGLQLDEHKQTLTMADQVVYQLTGTEFKLMRYFLLHPENVLSKSTLMEHVYDFDSEKDSNVIEVYVRRLRQILGKKRIVTLRGQGYVFKAEAC